LPPHLPHPVVVGKIQRLLEGCIKCLFNVDMFALFDYLVFMSLSSKKIPKQTLGFFSLSVAWTATMIICSVYQVIRYGKTQDIMMIVCWSGLFFFVGWAIFIVFPLSKLDHSRKIFQAQPFPFVTAAYGVAVYSLFLIGVFATYFFFIFIQHFDRCLIGMQVWLTQSVRAL
jgi:hypothetical protein